LNTNLTLSIIFIQILGNIILVFYNSYYYRCFNFFNDATIILVYYTYVEEDHPVVLVYYTYINLHKKYYFSFKLYFM